MMKSLAMTVLALAILTGCSSGGPVHSLGTGGSSASSSGSSSSSSGSNDTADNSGSNNSSSGSGTSGIDSSGNSTQATPKTYTTNIYHIDKNGTVHLGNEATTKAAKREDITEVVINGQRLPIIPLSSNVGSAHADTFTVYREVSNNYPYSVAFIGEKSSRSDIPTSGVVSYSGASHAVVKQSDGTFLESDGAADLSVDFGKKTVTGQLNKPYPVSFTPRYGNALDVNAVIEGSKIKSVANEKTVVDAQFYRQEHNADKPAGTIMGVFSNQDENISGAFYSHDLGNP